MPTSPELLTEITTRHQVYLEKYKTGVYNQYPPFLKRIAKLIRIELAGNDITEFKRARLEKLIKSINQDIKLIQGEYLETLSQSSLELARYEASFESKSLEEVVNYDFVIPTDNQLRSSVLTNPLTAKGANGQLLMPFLTDLSSNAVNNVTNAIRAGAYEGLTTQQIIKNIIGTKSKGYTDGDLAKLNQSVEAATRTGLQHVSVQAREETWKRNKDIIKEVQWTSTLDSRTSTICRSLDNQRFPVDSGPRPPAHIRCRSTVVAVLDDRFKMLDNDATRSARDADGKAIKVDANTSYYDWLKRQPAEFQDSVIGKTRGQLLRNGGLSSQRFSELQLGKNFDPLTLDEMQKLEPLAFDKIGK